MIVASKPGSRGVVAPVLLGALAILAALILNPWSLAGFLGPAHRVGGMSRIGMIVACELVIALGGVWLLWRRPTLRASLGVCAIAAILVGVLGVGVRGSVAALRGPSPEDRMLAAVDRSETLVLALAARHLPLLDKGAMNFHVPDERSRAVFAETVEILDLAPAEPEVVSELEGVGVRVSRWPVQQAERSASGEEVRLWEPFLGQVEYFRNAHFYIRRAEFLGPEETRLKATMGFGGLAWMKAGFNRSVAAKAEAVFVETPATDPAAPPDWRIVSWRTLEFNCTDREHLLYADVLDRVVSDREDLDRARTSIHEQYAVKSVLDKDFVPPHPYFSRIAFDRHPAVSVVDIDRDGFDDIYIMERMGKNMLFRNTGDGRFEEIAADVGLDIAEHTSGAIFADFDNDGDVDAFLGRTLAPSLYLVNEGGRFVERSHELIDTPLPYLVGSVSAADYDGDGLLDVYFSTYAAEMLAKSLPPATWKTKIEDALVAGVALPEYLPEEDSKELYRLLRDKHTHRIASWPGPPNLLLKNLGGGRFGATPDGEPLRVWRNTWQATWADYDSDGDPDLLVANDFAPKNMFRNDGGHFVEVTDETGTADLGFGMGVSWGDFDNDGRQDLYMTNMYSKAGQRITAQLGEFASRFRPMTRGNTLFHNQPGKWERVSGLEEPALLVEAAGWGWGSQFVDVDNDGFLDIYAPNGFYTAPKEIALPEDT